MKLSKYDGKTVRLTDFRGEVFDGEATWDSEEYCFHEYGEEEEGLRIDNWLFYRSQIRRVELLGEREPSLWMSRPLHRMKLQHEPFRMMELGQKTVELRLWDEKRRRLRVGDVIRFEDTTDETEVLYVQVEELLVFPGFARLYRSLPLLECGYTPANVSAASPADMYEYYSAEDEARWGAVGIRVSQPWFDVAGK